MRSVTFMLVATAASAVQSPPRYASAALRHQIERRYGEMNAAIVQRDAKALSGLLADDFKSEDLSGWTRTKEQMVRSVASAIGKPQRIKTAIRSVYVNGAQVRIERYQQMIVPTVSRTGEKHVAVLGTVFDDSWVQDHGVWRIRRIRMREMEQWLNGRLVRRTVKSTVHSSTQ